MNVLMISPGYPAEMAFFTRGLGQAGVTVIGLGEQSPDALPPEAKGALDHYVHTGSPGRRGPRPRDRARAGQARAHRPGRVPVGAVHGAGRAAPRTPGPARPDRGA